MFWGVLGTWCQLHIFTDQPTNGGWCVVITPSAFIFHNSSWYPLHNVSTWKRRPIFIKPAPQCGFGSETTGPADHHVSQYAAVVPGNIIIPSSALPTGTGDTVSPQVSVPWCSGWIHYFEDIPPCHSLKLFNVIFLNLPLLLLPFFLVVTMFSNSPSTRYITKEQCVSLPYNCA